MKRPLTLCLWPTLATLAVGCSMQTLAVRQTADLLAAGAVAIEGDDDLELVEDAFPANMKMAEALLVSDPDNEELLFLLSKGYGSYVFLFIEDAMERAALDDALETREALAARGRRLYLRARKYALRWLGRDDFEAAMGGPLEQLNQVLDTLEPDDVPALFWLSYAWGGYVNLGKHDPAIVAALSKVEACLRRAVALDKSYFYGGPLLALATLDASRSTMLGGKPKEAKAGFDEAMALSEGKFLLIPYIYARFYAVQVQDAALFRKLMTQVIEAPEDILPEQTLPNQLSKRRARRWLQHMDLLFEDDAAGDAAPGSGEEEQNDEATSDF